MERNTTSQTTPQSSATDESGSLPSSPKGLSLTVLPSHITVSSLQQLIPLLSPREAQILELLASGLCYKEIAVKLGVSRITTVHTYVYRAVSRLGARTKIQAVVWYVLAKELECSI
jgi:DNA-binding NarL/FixJ family response regulator